MDINLNIRVTFDAVPDMLNAMQILATTCKPGATFTDASASPAVGPTTSTVIPLPSADEKKAQREAEKAQREAEKEQKRLAKLAEKEGEKAKTEDSGDAEPADVDTDDDLVGDNDTAVTLQDVKEATQKAVFKDAANRSKIKTWLSDYGVEKASDLKEKDWAGYLQKVNKL